MFIAKSTDCICRLEWLPADCHGFTDDSCHQAVPLAKCFCLIIHHLPTGQMKTFSFMSPFFFCFHSSWLGPFQWAGYTKMPCHNDIPHDYGRGGKVIQLFCSPLIKLPRLTGLLDLRPFALATMFCPIFSRSWSYQTHLFFFHHRFLCSYQAASARIYQPKLFNYRLKSFLAFKSGLTDWFWL